jgi:hypothetical protein
MIKEVHINGLLFQEQRTYRIYASEENRTAGRPILTTSDEKLYKKHMRIAKNAKSQHLRGAIGAEKFSFDT